MRTEKEIRESLAEMERMANCAKNILDHVTVKGTPVLTENFKLWHERSKARASILKWVLGLPYLEELPPLLSSGQNPEPSVATGDAILADAGKQKT